MKFSKKVYLEWYRSILLQRRFEEKAAQLYGQQKIKGFCHLYIGQEAITAGMMSAIKKGDKVITAYRDHGHALAMGVSANAVMAELFGKETGCTGGKGGSMHMFSKEHNFVGGHGIVGAQIPMGAGLAFAEQYNNTGNVSLTFFGDGAARQAHCTKHSIWQCYGSYLRYSFVRTTNMRWERALNGQQTYWIFTRSDWVLICQVYRLME